MKHKIEFASHPANLSMVRNCVRQFVNGSALSPKEIDLIVLGVDEACTNIIRHVYKHEETHLIQLCCERVEQQGARGVRFRLRDFGAHPNEPHKLTGRSLEVVRPGGLGMHLIRTAFDQVDFNLQKIGTELVLTKHFTSHESTVLKTGTTG